MKGLIKTVREKHEAYWIKHLTDDGGKAKDFPGWREYFEPTAVKKEKKKEKKALRAAAKRVHKAESDTAKESKIMVAVMRKLTRKISDALLQALLGAMIKMADKASETMEQNGATLAHAMNDIGALIKVYYYKDAGIGPPPLRHSRTRFLKTFFVRKFAGDVLTVVDKTAEEASIPVADLPTNDTAVEAVADDIVVLLRKHMTSARQQALDKLHETSVFRIASGADEPVHAILPDDAQESMAELAGGVSTVAAGMSAIIVSSLDSKIDDGIDKIAKIAKVIVKIVAKARATILTFSKAVNMAKEANFDPAVEKTLIEAIDTLYETVKSQIEQAVGVLFGMIKQMHDMQQYQKDLALLNEALGDDEPGEDATVKRPGTLL